MEAPTATVEPPSLYVQMREGFAETMDALVGVEAMQSSIAAFRAQLVDEARRFSELADISRSSEPHAWKPDLVARKTLVSEVAAAMKIPQRTAETLIERSKALVNDLPATMAALQAGTISYRHVEKLTDHAFSLPKEAWAEFEEAVLPAAETLTVTKFDQKARKVRERVHPESIKERAVKSAANRSIAIDPAADGMVWLSAYLEADKAHAVFNRVTDIALTLRRPEDERTLTQLRADVFTDLLIDGEVPSSRGIRAQVLVTVPVLTLMGLSEEPANLDGYGPISPDVARKLAAHAPSFTRLLTHPETGVVLSVGRDRYRPPADLQAWLRTRDGTCRCPGCNQPARRTEIDHTEPWADGGTTSAENLACLCERDHDLKTHTQWKVRQIGGGKLEWTAPWSGRVYITEPDIDLPA